MKLILLLFSIVLNFAFIKEVSSNNVDKLMLVGFGHYRIEGDDILFDIFFKKYNNIIPYDQASIGFYLFNESLSFIDEINTNCINASAKRDDELVYQCALRDIKNVDKVKQVKLKNTSFTFYFNHINNETYKPKIIESSLAEVVKNNISSSKEDEFQYSTFYFENFLLTDDNVYINGRMEPVISENISGNIYTLNLTNAPYNPYICDIDNISISFNLNNSNINDNLIGKVINSSGDPILIFSNDPSKNDLLMYSTIKSSSADLYGFENYNKDNGKNATNEAIFFGTPNILKKYLRFTARIIYGSNGSNSNLRFLEEMKTNATGEIIPNSTDLDNGEAKYYIVYENTENISNILAIYSEGEFQTGDSLNSFSPVLVYYVGEDINLTNSGQLPKPVYLDFLDKPIIDGNTLALKFKLKSQNSIVNITNEQPVYLNYSSMETSERDVIDSCTIENNTNDLTIKCEPQKDIYALLNTFIIKVPSITTSRRLRFLQSSGNSTIRVPKTTTGDIQFEYNPEVNTFGRRSSKKKGLSGGAIAAIVLATIAAVAAVAGAIFFLNRGPINPIKTSTEMNLPNSTTNINN